MTDAEGTVFALPDLGEGLEEATIISWDVAVGDTVALNQTMCTVETAKAEVEIPSPYSGRVVELAGEAGDTIDVGAMLVRIAVGDSGAATAASAEQVTGERPVAAATPTGDRPASTEEQATGDGSPAQTAAGDGTSQRTSVLVGYGPGDSRRRTRSRERRGRADRGRRPERPRSTPPVRKLARDLGIDIADLHPGSGPGGRITRADVERAAAGTAAAPSAAAPSVAAPADAPRAATDAPPVAAAVDVAPADAEAPSAELGAPTDGRTIPLTGIRGRIAEHMTRSRREIPEATAGLWVDATALGELRDRLQGAADVAGHDVRITPFAVLLRMVLVAVRDFPTINSTIDVEAGEIRLHDHVHLGVATQTDRGLVVPVIRDAHRRTTLELAAELQRLAGSAREGKLAPAEMVGSTLTVTNFGAFGTDDGNPVINHPETAIVGVGSIKPRPWVIDHEIAVRSTVKLVCAFDHRVSDGAQGGGFLRRLGDLVERPDDLILNL